MLSIDLHQHMWPEPFVEALRRRSRPPRLVGWTLHLDGEPPYEVNPADHHPAARAGSDDADVIGVSLSSPLGVEGLPVDEATPLLDAWHDGVGAFGDPFRGWVSLSSVAPDLASIPALIGTGLLGLQVPAGELATPRRLEGVAPVLRVAEQLGCPVLVHPGPVSRPHADVPGWWPAVVDYTAQLQAAWWSWTAIGRSLLPELRICFAAGAGLAPLLAERAEARGGPAVDRDPEVFVDTSSHGPLALRALVSMMGTGALVLGSDRPYAAPTDPDLGPDVTTALRSDNPSRLLGWS